MSCSFYGHMGFVVDAEIQANPTVVLFACPPIRTECLNENVNDATMKDECTELNFYAGYHCGI